MDIEIIAINRTERKVLLKDDRVVEFHSIHDDEGDEVEDIADAAFAVIHVDEGWVPVLFCHFNEGSEVH